MKPLKNPLIPSPEIYTKTFLPNSDRESFFWNSLEPPTQIMAQGTMKAFDILEKLPDRGLAIVGTRYPLPRSEQLLRSWVRDLSQFDVVVVSGFARGIDAIAHDEAIEQGIPTVAILGNGIKETYPKSNTRLKKKLLESDNLILSEFPNTMPPLAHQFLRRNRLIAAYTKATIVVEAAKRSGALNTANWCRQQDKDCYAVPCIPGDFTMAGNQRLLDNDQAHPFWGVHSLGSSWLEMCTVSSQANQKNDLQNKNPSDSTQLVLKAGELLSQSGQVNVQDLFDWALSKNWNPERFFNAVRQAKTSGRLHESSGQLKPCNTR